MSDSNYHYDDNLLVQARGLLDDLDLGDPMQDAQATGIINLVANAYEVSFIEAMYRIMEPAPKPEIVPTTSPEFGRRPRMAAWGGIDRRPRPPANRFVPHATPFPTPEELAKIEEKTDFHDVLMVAFDIRGHSAEQVHRWLQSKMPACYGADDLDQGITLDAWWVANDERFDGSDTDSAVFVRRGEQSNARVKLRQYGLVD